MPMLLISEPMERLLTINVYMSTLNNSDKNFQLLQLIHQAVSKNVCAPKVTEKFSVSKQMRSSGDLEGDSQIALMLFVGVAKKSLIKKRDTIDFLGIEEEEYDFKLDKFFDSLILSENANNILDKRFFNKLTLILNYIRLHSK